MAQLTISDKVMDFDYPALKLGTVVSVSEELGFNQKMGVISDYMSGDYELIMINDKGIPLHETHWVSDTDLLSIADDDPEFGYRLINYFKFKVEPDARRGRFTDEDD